MRRRRCGSFPGLLRRGQLALRRDALFHQQMLQRAKPVEVISALAAMFGDLVAERRRPLAPGKQPALMRRHRHGEGLRLPGR